MSQSVLLSHAENDAVLADNPPVGEMSIFRQLPTLLSRAFAIAFLTFHRHICKTQSEFDQIAFSLCTRRKMFLGSCAFLVMNTGILSCPHFPPTSH